MNDLISRSALLESLRDKGWLKGDMTDSTEMIAVQSIIDEAPAVDAVEVVRCRDCEHWMYEYDDVGLCVTDTPDIDGVQRIADDFCRYGERRVDDG